MNKTKEDKEKKGDLNENAIAGANIPKKDLENIQSGLAPGQTSSNFGNLPHYQSVDTRAANICAGIYQGK